MDTNHFGRYQIKRLLGSGGMSQVYVAQDEQFGRDVALKIMSANLMQQDLLREKFEAEARTIARLEHYAIVPIYDTGEYNGRPYIAMRLMGGGTLADRLDSGPLPFDQVLIILNRICAALYHAHNNNVVHRDLKPGNILYDDGQMPYLADFGIARSVDVTQTMTSMGTPIYMAPEQFRDEAVDARTDVYQLGVMLYEILVGSPPFVSTNAVTLMNMHLNHPIPQLLDKNPSLPSKLQAVVSKAMAKRKEDRHPSTIDLARELSQALDERHADIPPTVSLAKNKPKWKRSKISSATQVLTHVALDRMRAMSTRQVIGVVSGIVLAFIILTVAISSYIRSQLPFVWNSFQAMPLVFAPLAYTLSRRFLAIPLLNIPLYIFVSQYTSYRIILSTSILGAVLTTAVLFACAKLSQGSTKILFLIGLPLAFAVSAATNYFLENVVDLRGILGAFALGIIGYIVSEVIAGIREGSMNYK